MLYVAGVLCEETAIQTVGVDEHVDVGNELA
jgi:hypothetical protein